jgi:hypothetical protein
MILPLTSIKHEGTKKALTYGDEEEEKWILQIKILKQLASKLIRPQW